MFEQMDSIELPDDVFRLLRELIKEYCGIFFDDSSKYLIQKRLSNRVRSHHLDSFRDYYRLLLYDKRRDEEFTAIMDLLTVNETYFFREMSQLKAFATEIVEDLKGVKTSTKSLRIWSAGCSSGEEPYTIAMLLMEKGASLAGWTIEIVGSDINQRVLSVARKGVYRKNSFRTTDKYYLDKYFEPLENGTYKIKDQVRKLVHFSHLNLLDPFKSRFVGRVDVVFCRNVLIYFDLESRRKVIENFYERLGYGGYLLLGHAESLMNVSTSFTLKHLKTDMVYQKPHKEEKVFKSDLLSRLSLGDKK